MSTFTINPLLFNIDLENVTMLANGVYSMVL
jgi:hypothetical protein